MPSDSEFVAKGLVRSFSNSLKEETNSSDGKSASRQTLEDALIEQVDYEDAFAALLRGATSRFEIKALLEWSQSSNELLARVRHRRFRAASRS